MTKKTKQHMNILAGKITVEGLFNWRKVASLLWQAGIDVQTGTVPVERLWANYVCYFPDAATGMKLPWWSLLNDLGYLRFNYRHFNHDDLPAFTRGDSLLAERIDNLVSITRALNRDSAGNCSAALEAPQEAFQDT